MATDENSAKNLALMFFLDHLIQKNGRRSIHDLSCQFGARGFTSEMRDAVGGTKESLAGFLGQYPSLFAINDGQVTLKGFGDNQSALGSSLIGAGLSARDRDVVKEAVDFFVEKLRKFGPELPIKSLLGHRSQASPEIRRASGCHLRDFAHFLSCHPQAFTLVCDRVCLKEALDAAGDDPTGSDSAQTASERVTAFLKSYVEQCESPVSLETLYREFCNRFTLVVRKHIATNPKELMQYLKTMRSVFFIRSNKVSLNRRRTVGEADEDDQATDVSSSSSASRQVNGQPPSSIEFEENSGGNNRRPVLARSLKAAVKAVHELTFIAEDMIGTPDLYRVLAVHFKTELIGEHEFLTNLSLCLPDGHVFVFDLAHTASILMECGLKDVLESDQYLKVIHGSRRLANILWQQYKIRLQDVFDTQLAMLFIEHKETGRPLFKLQPVPLAAVLRFLEVKPMHDVQAAIGQLEHIPDAAFKQDVCDSINELYSLFPCVYRSLKGRLPSDLSTLFFSMCHEATSVHLAAADGGYVASYSPVGSKGSSPPAPPSAAARTALKAAQSSANGVCCKCQALKLSVRTVACQTVSTGEIASSKYYTESP